MTEQIPRPNVVEFFLIFSKITLVSFGGGLTALARRTLVEDKRWPTDEEFLSAYALARVKPGANQANFAIAESAGLPRGGYLTAAVCTLLFWKTDISPIPILARAGILGGSN